MSLAPATGRTTVKLTWCLTYESVAVRREVGESNGLATEAVIVDSLLVHRSVENHVDAA